MEHFLGWNQGGIISGTPPLVLRFSLYGTGREASAVGYERGTDMIATDGRTIATLDAADALAVLAASVSASARLALLGTGDADDIAAEGYAAWLTAGKPSAWTIADAIRAGVASLRPSREGLTDDEGGDYGLAVYASASTADGLTIGDAMDAIADDSTGYRVATDGVRSFADGGRFAIVYAVDGYDTDGATYTDASGASVYGMDAILAARSAALREDTADEHGLAAAARGAKNQAASAGTDAAVAAAYRADGGGKGYAARVAVALGWLSADATDAQRLAAMNRVRVAVARMNRRTDGEDTHSARD